MTGDTGPHRVVLERWIACAPFERLLGMGIVEADQGRAVLTMPFTLEHAQGAGLMHGGALVSLADTAMTMAIKSVLPEGSHFATVELEARFLRPVLQGVVTAEARITSRQERTIHGQAHITDGEGTRVMEFTSVFRIARKSAGKE